MIDIRMDFPSVVQREAEDRARATKRKSPKKPPPLKSNEKFLLSPIPQHVITPPRRMAHRVRLDPIRRAVADAVHRRRRRDRAQTLTVEVGTPVNAGIRPGRPVGSAGSVGMHPNVTVRRRRRR